MLRTLFAAALLGILTVVLGTIAIVTWPLAPNGYLIQKLAIIWSWLTLKACGAKLVVQGRQSIDPKATYVFTSNHCSTFDILALLYLQPARRFRFIAKKSLFRIPFFGWAMSLGGFIGIDRSNKKKAMETTQAALQRIQTGTSVVIYPEGTRSYDGRMLPFKTGGFLMAIRAGVPVIPLTMVNSHYLQPKGRFLARPGTLRIIFDAPIPTKDLQERDRGMLAAKVRDVIARNLIEAGQMTKEDYDKMVVNTVAHAGAH